MSVLGNQIVNSDDEYWKKCWQKLWSKRYVLIVWDSPPYTIYSYIDTQLTTYTGGHSSLADCLKSTEPVYTDAYKVDLSKPHKILVESDEPITSLNYPELFV